ncbi:MAG TPA: ion channel, partial [Vicinamibacterales bacterium]|nr:ion channel [Vicinamibacterales bacterium]
MKTLPAILAATLADRRARQNLRTLRHLLLMLVSLILIYTVVFHFLMEYEGQRHSWFTGIYWTVVAMSTLGFGDITFQSDLGRLFSVVVVLSGMIVLLIILPFTFIQFFYAPWLEARDAARAPRSLPPDTTRHVILTSWGPIEMALAPRLRQFGTACVVVVPELAHALELHDSGVTVMLGDFDDPDTYVRAKVGQASLVVATGADTTNTNIAATVREASDRVPIVATA